MSRGRFGSLAALVVGLCCWCSANAFAAPVVVLGADGKAHVGNDPFLRADAITPVPATGTAPPRAREAKARATAPSASSTLTKLLKQGKITPAAYQSYRATLTAAERLLPKLSGTRAAELGAVLANLHAIAVTGELTPSRLPVLFLTLANNTRWWNTGYLLSYGERVEFAGSLLVWEYYPGQGIELQELGSFGKADAYYTAGKAHYPQLRQILAELIPLAAQRAGGATWEYYFNFDGGVPPWTSAMSQGTALDALARAYKAFHDPSYLTLAHQALPVFNAPPPAGVAIPTSIGTRYLQYSFAPGASIINAFLQSLIGLYDYAHVSHDATAQKLFDAGNAEAIAELPSFVAGGWSLYQPGVIDSLDYHVLVTGFLQLLCHKTKAPVYCNIASSFSGDLKTPPGLRQITTTVKKGAPFSLLFHLSKYAHVGIVVTGTARTVLSTSAWFGYGTDAFTVPGLGKGIYTVRLAATDLAGNFNRIVGTLQVTR